ncbi:MAG: hypothetical protein OES84_03755 [Kiritimatiellaceae bacterium]|nr:hypothetical protein [Kiritimatiellaceae bacterium]
MDIGKFKSNPLKLTLWIMVPLVLTVGMGLSSYALKLQSEWQLSRTQVLSEILPQLAKSQDGARNLIKEFQGLETERVKTEDEFISFLQSAASQSGFTIDSLKVDRRVSVQNGNSPVLVASVKGAGTFQAVETYLGDVTSSQHLLSESSLQISQASRMAEEGSCRADIVFELFLFETSKPEAGGGL